MKTKWLVLSIIGILVLLLIAGWLQGPATKKTQTEKPVTMQKYIDPENVYTVSVPSNWTKSNTTATSTTGLKTGHPVQQDIKVTQFTKPAEMGFTVQVISGPPTCPLQNKPNTSLAGLPAFYNPANYTWTISATTATVLVSIAYPGTNSFHRPLTQAQAPPYPVVTINADKALVRSMLNSLTFPELRPLTCN